MNIFAVERNISTTIFNVLIANIRSDSKINVRLKLL